MSRMWKIILVLVAVISFGVALSYPLLYKKAESENESGLERLADIRAKALREAEESAAEAADLAGKPENGSGAAAVPASDAGGTEASGSGAAGLSEAGTPGALEQEGAGMGSHAGDLSGDGASGAENAGGDTHAEGTFSGAAETASGAETQGGETPGEGTFSGAAETASGAETQGGETPGEGTFSEMEEVPEARSYEIEDFLLDYVPGLTWRQVEIPEYEEYDAPVLLKTSKAAVDRDARQEALPYPMKEHITLDTSKILPELREIYEINRDLVGWIDIPGTEVDFPVVQTEDSEFYLTHDFFGEENRNGQIILDTKCDPYTPSYNLVISGHHMRSGAMFGNLPDYKDKEYWEGHKLVEFDNLMARGTYVIFGAFYSADYDQYEEGFRYNANIQYKIDADQWLAEVAENALYETDIPVAFGDEFITLTTCERSKRQNGRFVVVCRRIREGEEIA